MVLNFPLLLSGVLVPIVLSVLLPFLGRSLGKKSITAIAFILLLYPLALTVFFTIQTGLREPVVDPVIFQSDSLGSFSALLDPLSAPLAISIGLVTTLIAAYSLPYMEHRFEEMEKEKISAPDWGTYYMLYVMFSAAMMGTVLSTNLVEFYIFLELSLLPSFLLIAFYGYGNRERIALMYLIWTHVGALVFLIGSLIVGLSAGTFDFYDPIALQPNMGLGSAVSPALRLPVAIAMVLGLFVKLAILGVHIWLPYAHAEAPTPVSALLSPNLIGIAGYALVRVAYTLFPDEFSHLTNYMLPLALLTIIYGGLMALAQDDFKRLLAYSSISQMGYLLLGISTLTTAGIAGAMVHYAAHAVGKALLFTTAGVLIVQLHGLRSISKMGGIAPKMPLTASLALIGFMHITGIPPSLGLWSEVLIISGAAGSVLSKSAIAFIGLLIALLIGIGLSTAYAFLTMKRIFFGQPSEAALKAKEAGWNLLAPMAIVAAAGVLLFIWPSILIDPLVSILSSLLG